MRLYAKLALMILLFALLQWGVLRERSEEWWFAARCQIAYVTGDIDLKERLIVEAGAQLARRLEDHHEGLLRIASR